MKMRAIVFSAIVLAVCGWVIFATKRNSQPVPPVGVDVAKPRIDIPESEGALPPEVAGSREPAGEGGAAETVLPVAESPVSPSVVPTDADAFPPEYTGIRDKNLAGLYSTFKLSISYEGRKLENASQADIANGIQLNYLESSAYVSLIQGQRLYYYGYTQPSERPPNSSDVEYHLTGAGGMYVIFELTRQAFPDLFEAKDNRKRFLSRQLGTGR